MLLQIANSESVFFIGFLLLVAVMLVIDLGFFNRKDHVISIKEATGWSFVWIGISLAFYTALYFYGHLLHNITSIADLQRVSDTFKQKFEIDPNNFEQSVRNYRHVMSTEFLTGYLIEKSLSLDNLFVILLIFKSFKVEEKLYHRVLYWGILGAILLRFVFIFAGSWLVIHFDWILYLFGAFLVYSGIKALLSKNGDDKPHIDVEHHPVVKFASKYMRVLPTFDGRNFFLFKEHRFFFTPLFIVLIMVEISDVIFAFDSIPAIFGITKDPYIVFFSNIFAILGLRALFFLVQSILSKFRFFDTGLAILLIFIGAKLIFEEYLHDMGFGTVHSLAIVVAILGGSMLLSVIFKEKKSA